MKQINHFIVLLLTLAATTATMFAQDNTGDRITQAVMRVYDEQLAKNPNDYNTLFARANQLYYNGDYEASLNDVNKVMGLIPDKDKDLRFDALMLRARIFDSQNNLEQELIDLKTAQVLQPQSMACTDMMAKAYLQLNDTDAAEANFNTILRNEPLNFDALYGLARVAVKRNRPDEAVDYATRAVNLFTAEPQVYINRSDILSQLGYYSDAAQDLISASCVGNDGGRSLAMLVQMSDSHYDEVMNALAESTDKAPTVGMFYYVRASIAMRHFHYGQALRDLKLITENDFYNSASIYYNTALCQLNLMQYDDALTSINKAIAIEPNRADFYETKAWAQLRRGRGNNFDDALRVLDEGLKVEPTNEAVLLAQCRVHLLQGNETAADADINALLKAQPSNPEALLMHGWINKYRLNGGDLVARADFEQILLTGSDFYSLRGFALHELGRDDEARQWAADIVANGPKTGGEPAVYAAALMAEIGDNTAALDYLKSALAAGYGSLYELRVNDAPCINLSALRKLPEFNTLLSDWQTNFQERR